MFTMTVFIAAGFSQKTRKAWAHVWTNKEECPTLHREADLCVLTYLPPKAAREFARWLRADRNRARLEQRIIGWFMLESPSENIGNSVPGINFSTSKSLTQSLRVAGKALQSSSTGEKTTPFAIR